MSSETLKTIGRDEWRYPNNRRQAISYQEEGIPISLEKSMAGNLVNFLQSIGADKEIPDGKHERVSWLNHFHSQLAVNNPLWPVDMSFQFVYAKFVTAVMYDRAELKGHNIHAFITAFKNWITQSGIETTLREEYYQEHPEKTPKQLQPVFGDSQHEIEMNRLIQGKKMEDWPDEVILDLYKQIKAMYRDGLLNMIDKMDGKNRIRQIIEIVKERGLADYDQASKDLYGNERATNL